MDSRKIFQIIEAHIVKKNIEKIRAKKEALLLSNETPGARRVRELLVAAFNSKNEEKKKALIKSGYKNGKRIHIKIYGKA